MKKGRLDIELEVLKNAMVLQGGITDAQLRLLEQRIEMVKIVMSSLPLQIKEQILS